MSYNDMQEYIGTVVAIVCYDKDGPSLCVPSGSRARTRETKSATDDEFNPNPIYNPNLVGRQMAKANEEMESPEVAGARALPERSVKILMAPKGRRRETYKNCRLPPEDVEALVEAGFYYEESSGCTRCFSCGGGLRDWKTNDDVWAEHAKAFPKCSHVLENMNGQRPGRGASTLHAPDNLTIILGNNTATISELLQPLRCKCCSKDRIQVVFFPCGHLSCYRCAHTVRNRPCYACEARIEGRLKMKIPLF